MTVTTTNGPHPHFHRLGAYPQTDVVTMFGDRGIRDVRSHTHTILANGHTSNAYDRHGHELEGSEQHTHEHGRLDGPELVTTPGGNIDYDHLEPRPIRGPEATHFYLDEVTFDRTDGSASVTMHSTDRPAGLTVTDDGRIEGYITTDAGFGAQAHPMYGLFDNGEHIGWTEEATIEPDGITIRGRIHPDAARRTNEALRNQDQLDAVRYTMDAMTITGTDLRRLVGYPTERIERTQQRLNDIMAERLGIPPELLGPLQAESRSPGRSFHAMQPPADFDADGQLSREARAAIQAGRPLFTQEYPNPERTDDA